MKFTSRTDTFDVINGTEIMNCRYFDVQYTDTTVLLVVYGIAPPQLHEDTLSIRQDEPVVVNVLANDTTTEGDTLMVVAVGTPLHGTVVVNGDSTLLYTPETGYVGADSMTYVVMRRTGCVDSSRLILNVYSTVGIHDQTLAGGDAFSVEPVRPNPFEGSTTFRFYLPEASFTELRVYNVFGQLMYVGISEKLPAGSHRYEFNAPELPAGIYLYRLRAGDRTKTGRMIRMR